MDKLGGKMNKTKNTNELNGEKLFRDEEFSRGSTEPFVEVNGQSNIDRYDRSELNVSEQKDEAGTGKVFVEDFDGDEDFYGDDEENQSGAVSYTGNQGRYLGQGDWADKEFGENQFNHKGDVDHATRDEKNVHAISGNVLPLKTKENKNE